MAWLLGFGIAVVMTYMLWVIWSVIKAGYDAWKTGEGTDYWKDGKGLWH